MKSTPSNLRPFLKWAGGKSQLLGELRQRYPFETESGIVKYAEPFVGGGAVLFDILSRYSLQEVYISDINAELINAYKVIKDHIYELIHALTDMQEYYLPADDEARKRYYYEKRALFNGLKLCGDTTANIRKAALMIFLNRTCFNGLFRVNRKGAFNVPIGAYKKPLICDAQNLRNISDNLQNVTIVCADYRQSERFIDDKTFVYFDPPYRPLTQTASFTAYTEALFDDNAQTELADFFARISKAGAKAIVSNSDPKNANADDDFFDALYAQYHMHRIEATRMISCNSKSRGKISELLIANF